MRFQHQNAVVKKLAILVIFALVGAVTSPLLAGYCHKPGFPPIAAEEVTNSPALDGLSFDRNGHWGSFPGLAGLAARIAFSQCHRLDGRLTNTARYATVAPSRLFLLYHAFQLYGPA
ncbi:MAG: hypothetical protein KDC66_10300 [Phaeodactylibacter sp.]|nr:hypothetical protein [Phaeodactylibacter sp.]MCB9274720.1 hypothetical protein [Lewinellaceae bacterium]